MTFKTIRIRTILLQTAGAALLGTLTCTASPAWAEAGDTIESVVVIGVRPGDEGIADYRVTHSTTGAKADLLTKDIPQSITVVPQKILEEQNVETVNDALANVAGMIATTSNIQGAGQWVTSRGFQNRNFYKDGLRDDTFDRSYWLGNVERVEVLKGPSSVLYGDGSLGGAINIVSKKPLLENTVNALLWGGNPGEVGGGIDASARLTDSGSVLMRVVADKSHNDSYIDDYSYDAQHASLSVQALVTPRTVLTVGSEYRDRKSDGNLSGIPAYAKNYGLDRATNFNTDWSFRQDTGENVSVHLTHEFSGDWKLNVNGALNRYYFNQALTSPTYTAALAKTGYVTLSPNNTRSTTEEVVTDSNVEGHFTTFGFSHTLVAGAENSYYDIDRLRFGGTLTGASFSIFAPNEAVAEPTWKQNLHINYVMRRKAAYAQDLIAITPSLKILLGGRYDDVNRHQNDLMNASNTLHVRYHEWSKRFGITYDILPGITAFGGYSQSFVPPGDENTTSLGTLPKADPEHGEQYEAGFKFDIGNAFSATAALYQLTRKNVRTTDTATNTTSVVGEQQSKGFEFDSTWKIAPNWNLLATYAFNDAQIRADKKYKVGNQLVNAPHHSASVWTMYEISTGMLSGLGFGGGVRYVGTRTANLTNTYTIPDYWTLNLSTFYRLTDHIKLSLNADNIFDRTYYVAASGDDLPSIYFGDPATVTFKVSVAY